MLNNYTKCGFRVLALYLNADRSSDIQRDEIEDGLEFLGFMIMQNKLKPAT
jgi:magnesium-transporting ATPase (P-type)